MPDILFRLFCQLLFLLDIIQMPRTSIDGSMEGARLCQYLQARI